MKHIAKQNPPQIFIDWLAQANDDWKPKYADLRGDEKSALLESLKQEQGYICCYCERSLDSDCHIEHFRPKDVKQFPELELTYENLHCSCQLELKKKTPLHCGNAKSNWFDEKLLISPLDESCESRFSYSADGSIYPTLENDLAAKTTIEKLKLDLPKLNEQRKKLIEAFIESFVELTKEEVDIFVVNYLKDKSQNNGQFNEFYTTVKHLFSKEIQS